MSDQDNGGKGSSSKPGRGSRSLQTWWGLAAARQAVRDDPKAKEQFEQDPDEFFKQHGVSGLSPEELKGQVERVDEVQQQLNEFELQKDQALLHQARGGIAWIGIAWAGAAVINATWKYNANF